VKHRVFLHAGWLWLAAPGAAQANVGVPMIFITLPQMLVALVPVIAIEALYARRALRLSQRQAFTSFGVANLVSTLIGIPLAWGALVLLQMATGAGHPGIETPWHRFLAVTWEGAWLVPYRGYEHELYWMVPAATLFLLVPFFFASWWVEYLIVARLLRPLDRSEVRRATFRANLLSYGLLTLIALVRLVIAFGNPS
jgi:hypothetical protein